MKKRLSLYQPKTGFQTRKRPCNTFYRKQKETNHCVLSNTNRLGDFATREFQFDRIFNRIPLPNVPSKFDRNIPGKCRRPDPNLPYRKRPIPNKNKHCNICLPDAIINRGGSSRSCRPLEGNCNCNGSASFTQTQNQCLCPNPPWCY